MGLVQFEAGDEIVISRRRKITTKDAETGAEVEQLLMEELSAVSCPARCTIGGAGGSVGPEFIADPQNEQRDRRFLVVRLPMRY